MSASAPVRVRYDLDSFADDPAWSVHRPKPALRPSDRELETLAEMLNTASRRTRSTSG